MSTNTRELTIGEILLLSARMAGIMPLEQSAVGPQWDARASFGRDQLKLILDGLQREGVIVRSIEQATATFVEGTGSYPLASDTVDVVGDGMYFAVGSTAGVLVRQVDREEWHRYPDKTSQSIPAIMYVQRHAVVSLEFLPLPNETGATLTVQRQRLLADTTDSSATPDLERYWIDYIQHELAARYAFSGGLRDASKELKQIASDLKDEAMNKANQGIDNRMVLDHPTGWNYR